MIAGQLRLALRLHRFELVAFGLLTVIAAAIAVIAAVIITDLAPPVSCFSWDGMSPRDPACDAVELAFYQAQGAVGWVVPLLIVLPWAAGVFFGVPLIAREIERGTARLAWSLSPSRPRWFALRALPILVVLGGLAFLAGAGLDRITAATRPELDVANAFDQFGLRGGLVASRALAIFGASVLVGAIVGRVLPGVILAAVLATIGLTAIQTAHVEVLKGEALVVDSAEYVPGAMYVGGGFQMPDGSVAGYDDVEGWDENGNPRYQEVTFVVPGERYRAAEAREAIVLGGITVVSLALAAVVVGQRRPD